MAGVDPRLWKRLLELAPPPAQPVHPGTDEEWLRAAQQLGHPFPKDYVAIVRTYGEGYFHQFMRLLTPFAANEAYNLFDWRDFAHEVLNGPEILEYAPSGASSRMRNCSRGRRQATATPSSGSPTACPTNGRCS